MYIEMYACMCYIFVFTFYLLVDPSYEDGSQMRLASSESLPIPGIGGIHVNIYNQKETESVFRNLPSPSFLRKCVRPLIYLGT
jgi:hypothetical protein